MRELPDWVGRSVAAYDGHLIEPGQLWRLRRNGAWLLYRVIGARNGNPWMIDTWREDDATERWSCISAPYLLRGELVEMVA